MIVIWILILLKSPISQYSLKLNYFKAKFKLYEWWKGWDDDIAIKNNIKDKIILFAFLTPTPYNLLTAY